MRFTLELLCIPTVLLGLLNIDVTEPFSQADRRLFAWYPTVSTYVRGVTAPCCMLTTSTADAQSSITTRQIVLYTVVATMLQARADRIAVKTTFRIVMRHQFQLSILEEKTCVA
ncbi:hypothetical protein F5146DRAFT_373006 [Armillaria mellea]|nr:hypothetical protein F5146DRAFT_373006 [Armillaria mellea]